MTEQRNDQQWKIVIYSLFLKTSSSLHAIFWTAPILYVYKFVYKLYIDLMSEVDIFIIKMIWDTLQARIQKFFEGGGGVGEKIFVVTGINGGIHKN